LTPVVTFTIWPRLAAIEAALPNGSEAEARSDGKGGYPVNVAALDWLKAMCGSGAAPARAAAT
jgi:hypothetical protein